MEHAAEGQENNRGLLRGVLDEVRGVIKISQFLNLVIAADLRRPSPSSLPNEDQWEGKVRGRRSAGFSGI